MPVPVSESSPSDQDKAPPKRTRVLLSCAPCRFSKLKCDRKEPCSQCEKKARADQCVYAPRPIKKKPPPKNMKARLKRLEGLVRHMMDDDGDDGEKQPAPALTNPQTAKAKVVHGNNGATFIGATHCMAMLEDIEDLRSYFDEEEPEEATPSSEDLDSVEMLLLTPGSVPHSRYELVAEIPERAVCEELIRSYFSANSPSQHIVHRPRFAREYARFWENQDSATLHWLAQFFMMLALGAFCSGLSDPSEADSSPFPVQDRIKHFRACASRALVLGKYTQPSAKTMTAFLFYVESYIIFNRNDQVNSYVLSGVNLRLLLKLGLHRDPSKIGIASPFEGEMRRRIWNMATQLELLISFHMGLPSMLEGIESDTDIPRNLHDEDFDEDSKVIPPGRPPSEFTGMTYPILKSKISRVFSRIARQAHALTLPDYMAVLKLDSQLQEVMDDFPAIMRVRPLEECVFDDPRVVVKQIGLATLYNKALCVLHRRYLAESTPSKEHDYSRKRCLHAALALLRFQDSTWRESRPGGVLSKTPWFLSSVAVHDYLLAAMIIYLVVQNENYPDPEAGFGFDGEKPSKHELVAMLRRSYDVWSAVAATASDLKRAGDLLGTIVAKLGHPPVDKPSASGARAPSAPPAASQSATDQLTTESDLMASLGLDGPGSSGFTPFSMDSSNQSLSMPYTTVDALPDAMDFDPIWIANAENMDWRYLDVSFAQTSATDQTWDEKAP